MVQTSTLSVSRSATFSGENFSIIRITMDSGEKNVLESISFLEFEELINFTSENQEPSSDRAIGEKLFP